MKAILRVGYARHYLSPIFGVYRDPASARDPFDAYVVCLDERREALTVHPLNNAAAAPSIYPALLFTDASAEGFVTEGAYLGAPFVPFSLAQKIAAGEAAPADVVARCRAMDDGEAVDTLRTVRTDDELERLMSIVGYFHDRRIECVCCDREQDTVSIEFSDVWGCTLELFFEGDTACVCAGEPPETYGGRWMGGDIRRCGEYFYLADGIGFEPHELNDEYCWMRGKTLRFCLTPGI